jgi:2,5-diamino-6-(ribosylamino)-4(3H)-pyrimidinone 5'-phosphate reductase
MALTTRDADGLNKQTSSVVAFRTDPMAKPPSLLAAIFGEDVDIKEERPKVTLTFAQSLDAKIAGIGGKQLILSGRESMVMTHW